MQEQNLSNAELAILSLIAEKPRHGYELESVIEERGMRAWTEVAFSSIYFILNGLVKKELATSSLQPAAGRGPARKVYSATTSGYVLLHDGIVHAISGTQHDDQRFLLGLSCLPLLNAEEAKYSFTQRIHFLQEKIEELSAHPVFHQPGFPLHVKAMFEYSLHMLHAELDWSQSFLFEYTKGFPDHGKTGSQKTV
jgi:DNA-binding PadR family transcriptional regulator